MKQHSPACERNQEPIARVLAEVLPERGVVVEIGSGTGQHVVHFGRRFPGLTWQPTDRAGSLDSVRAWMAEARLSNVREPLEFDLFDASPPVGGGTPGGEGELVAVLAINVVHIAPVEASRRLFEHAARMLGPGGVLVTYGPYRFEGRPLEPSNEAFDRWLKERDPRSGIRDFEALDGLARTHGFELEGRRAMPANNHMLWWRKA